MQSNDLNEQHRYPDPGRPILRYERTFRQAGLYTHWHEELELLLVHEGTARFRKMCIRDSPGPLGWWPPSWCAWPLQG